MEKRQQLYSGKAKSIFATDEADLFIMHFRDDTSAFDGERMESLARKGMVNNKFNAFIMQTLAAAGVPTHFGRLNGDNESVVKPLDMIPLDGVVLIFAAGSLVKRLGVTEGVDLNPPTFELFLKNDALHDPMVNEYHARSFGWASEAEIARMKELSFKVNDVLKKLFRDAGMLLVDYKLEFGRCQGEVVLGDEFSPDGCRLWDADTRNKLDKDRFRQGLGGVVEAYEEVAHRLGVPL